MVSVLRRLKLCLIIGLIGLSGQTLAQTRNHSGIENMAVSPRQHFRLPDMTPIDPNTHGTLLPPETHFPKLSFIEPAQGSFYTVARGPSIRTRLDEPLHPDWPLQGSDSPYWMWLGFMIENMDSGHKTHFLDALTVENRETIRRPEWIRRGDVISAGRYRMRAYLYNSAESQKWIAQSGEFDILPADRFQRAIRVRNGEESRICQTVTGSPLYSLPRASDEQELRLTFSDTSEGVRSVTRLQDDLVVQCVGGA